MPPPQRVGDPRALLAAVALIVTAFIHGKPGCSSASGAAALAWQLVAAQTTISAILAGAALLTFNNRVWLFAVVLSLSGLVGALPGPPPPGRTNRAHLRVMALDRVGYSWATSHNFRRTTATCWTRQASAWVEGGSAGPFQTVHGPRCPYGP